jgi:hypothetical protein
MQAFRRCGWAAAGRIGDSHLISTTPERFIPELKSGREYLAE